MNCCFRAKEDVFYSLSLEVDGNHKGNNQRNSGRVTLGVEAARDLLDRPESIHPDQATGTRRKQTLAISLEVDGNHKGNNQRNSGRVTPGVEAARDLLDW